MLYYWMQLSFYTLAAFLFIREFLYKPIKKRKEKGIGKEKKWKDRILPYAFAVIIGIVIIMTVIDSYNRLLDLPIAITGEYEIVTGEVTKVYKRDRIRRGMLLTYEIEIDGVKYDSEIPFEKGKIVTVQTLPHSELIINKLKNPRH